jgi:hypothetical protein
MKKEHTLTTTLCTFTVLVIQPYFEPLPWYWQVLISFLSATVVAWLGIVIFRLVGSRKLDQK